MKISDFGRNIKNYGKVILHGFAFQKLIAVCLVVALLAAMCPTGLIPEVYAASNIASGTCGDNLTWTLDDEGTLTISGTGAMTDYDSSEIPWRSNCSLVKSVVIESGVTNICNFAFYLNYNALTSVIIPNSVTSIGDFAFYYCAGLTSITIPENVTSIGDNAFDGCTGLTYITIPESVTSIGAYAFCECTGLTSITIPDSVTNIGDTAFSGTGLTSVTIPNSVDSISDYTFSNCSSLTSITIPESVTSIGDYAFCNCSAITSITIPISVTTVGTMAFWGCSGLKEVNYKGTQAKWEEITIEGNNDSLINATIHCATPVIVAQGSCGDNLTWTLDDEGSLTISGAGAMMDYVSSSDVPWYTQRKSIKKIVIVSGVTSIGDSAFSGCTALTSVTIPDSVTSIGDSAFNSCTGLTGVYITDIASWCKISFSGYFSNPLYYAKKIYLNGEPVTDLVIPDSVTSIGDYAFRNCTGLTSVTIPDSVTSIGGYAFEYCIGLTGVIIGSGVTSIGDSAFEGCTDLTSVTIPDGVTSVGSRAFYNCTGLEEINFNATAMNDLSSRSYVFCNAGGLSNGVTVNIGENVTKIPARLFDSYANAPKIKKVTFAEGSVCKSIGEYAFFECSLMLSNITIGKSVTSIGARAFSGCTALTSVTIPDSVTSIGNYTFYGTRLTDVYYGGTQAQWDAMTIGSDNECFTSATIHTVEPELTGIAIKTQPAKTEYWVGEEMDTTGLTLTATYSDGSTADITDGFTVTGFDSENVGEQVITVAYEGFTATFTVEVVYGGTCGENLTWTLDDEGTLTISGTGAMSDFSYCGSPWYGYKTRILRVVVESGVTTIGAESFAPYFDNMTDVVLGADVTSIGDHAFDTSRALTNVNIPDSVTYIGDYAFQDCPKLLTVEIPADVSYIGECAFQGCSDLTGIFVDENNQYYTSDTKGVLFSKDKTRLIQAPGNLTGDYTILDEVLSIDQYAFYGCNVNMVTLGAGIEQIGELVFSTCGLTAVSIPCSVSVIADKAFLYCDSLTDVYYSGTAEQWAEITIGSDNEALTSATIHTVEVVTGIAIKSQPSKTEYWVGESLETTGLMLTATYSDGSTQDITEGFTVSGLDSATAGEQAVTVTYEGFTATIAVTVKEIVVTGIAIKSQPSKTEYWVGESLDTTGLTLTATYSNGSTKEITEGFTVTGFDSDIAGEQTITVTYEGFTAAFAVTVKEIVVTGITIKSQPSKTEYWVGESLDTTGLTLTATYSDGSTKEITEGFTVSGFDSATAGEQTVTVTYEGFTATIAVTVKEIVVTGIAIKSQPSKTEYWVGESLDTTGLTLTATYSNGSTKEITEGFTVTGFDSDIAGEQTITVTYEGFTATIAVTVKEIVVTGIAIKTQPAKTEYWVGEEMDTTGLTLTATYSDGSAQDITEGFTVSGFDSATAGEQTITVTYEGFTTTYTVTVTLGGTCGDNLTWTLDDEGTLIISGTGAMMDYSSSSDVPWYSYKTSVKKVVIKSGVTTIGSYAFYGCTRLEEINFNATAMADLSSFNYVFAYAGQKGNGITVNIGANVTKIPSCLFYPYSGSMYAPKLKTVTFAEGSVCTSIGSYAFAYCTGLTSITIPDSVTSTGSHAFEYCTGLTNITIPASVTSIGSYAFYYCAGLTSIQVEEGNTVYHSSGNCLIETASKTLIQGCSTSQIPTDGSVTSIGSYAFSYCTGLANITIPDSVTSIECSAFSYCTGLTSIQVEEGNTVYHSSGNCLIETESKTLIQGCSTSQIPTDGSVTNIGSHAFYNCTGLTSVTIPDSVTSIGYSAFAYCTGLTSVTIPDSVTRIGSYAFSGCTGLEEINFNATAMADLSSSNYVFAYAGQDGNGITVNIGANVTRIPAYLFYPYAHSSYAPKLKTVTFAEGSVCTSIGNYAFYNCTSLTSVTIPDSMTSIGEYAFYGCTGLSSITIPDSVTSLGNAVFAECSSLNYNTYGNGKYLGNKEKPFLILVGPTSNDITTCSFPDGVKVVSPNAFNNCTLLSSITMSDSVQIIGDYAFANCTSLTDITIPNGITNIGYDVFHKCSSLNYNIYHNGMYLGNNENPYLVLVKATSKDITTINFPEGVRFIYQWAFHGCDNLEYAVIPNGVTDIGFAAFASSNNLKEITIPTSIMHIGAYVFEGCTGLCSVTFLGDARISDSNTIVDTWAFRDCDNLTGVYITDMEVWTSLRFHDVLSNPLFCAGNLYLNNELVTDLVIPEGVSTIGEYAFIGATCLASVTIPNSATNIGDEAFYNCTGLTDVYYNGTAAQWAQVSIGNDNEDLTGATIHTVEIVTDITIKTQPTKTEYWVGESLDTTGLVLTATYSDGSTQDITEGFTVTGFDSDIAGEQTITVTYEGLTATFTVTVKEYVVDENAPQIVLESKKVTKGSEFTVTVEIKNNPGFAYLGVTPVYSSELTLVQVVNGELISDFTKGNQYLWVSDGDVTDDGLLMTFTFSVADTVESGHYQVGFTVRTCGDYDEEAVTLSVVAADIEVIDYVHGDATGDGIVDGFDVIRLKKYLANYDYDTESSTIEVSAGADANGDGLIDGFDVIRLKKYLANYDYETGTSTVVLGPQ